MVSFTAAATLLAVAPAIPSANGFTSNAPPVRCPARPLHATEAFQRSLLKAQLANSNDSADDALVVDDAPVADDGAAPAQDEGEPSGPPPLDGTAVQNSLLRIAASTDRGQFATVGQKDRANMLIADLESEPPSCESSYDESVGTWELLYSNTQLFRSSPFFLAGRSTCQTPEQAAQYDWFCDMHRAALAISTIGVVRQVITSGGRLVNEFEVKVGAVPFLSDFVPFLKYSGGWPVTIDGAIVSTADATPTSSTEWELYMDTVEIKGSNIPLLRNLLDAENVKLSSRDLSDVLETAIDSYETPKPALRTTYIDEGMRIVRDEDENVFVYGRVSESEEPTDYSDVMADLGVASLLEGFNDAVAKVYL